MPIILAKQAFQFGLLGHLDILLLVNKQWVKVANSGAKYDQTITWPLAFTNTNYAFVLAPTPNFESAITSAAWKITAKNTNNFTVRVLEDGGLYTLACGN